MKTHNSSNSMDSKKLIFKTITSILVITFAITTISWSAPDLLIRRNPCSYISLNPHLLRQLSMSERNGLYLDEEFSNKVLEPLKRFKVPQKDASLIQKAFDVAKEALSWKMRKDGVTPYVIHPIEVANILISEFNITDPKIIAAALLHDVIEDYQEGQEAGEKKLSDNFGEEEDIVRVVKDLSIPKAEGQPAKDQAEKSHLAELLTKSKESQVIRIADRVHNVSDLKNTAMALNNREWVRHYVNTTLESFIPFLEKSAAPAYIKVYFIDRFVEECKKIEGIEALTTQQINGLENIRANLMGAALQIPEGSVSLENSKVFVPLRNIERHREEEMVYSDDDILFSIKVISGLNMVGITPYLIVYENSDIEKFERLSSGMRLKYTKVKPALNNTRLVIVEDRKGAREFEFKKGESWRPIIVEQVSRFTGPYIPATDVTLPLSYTTSSKPLIISCHGFTDYAKSGGIAHTPGVLEPDFVNIYSQPREPARFSTPTDPNILAGFLYDPSLLDLVEGFKGTAGNARGQFIAHALNSVLSPTQIESLNQLLKDSRTKKAVFNQGNFPNAETHSRFFELLGANFKGKEDPIVIFTSYDYDNEKEKDFIDWHRTKGHNFLDMSGKTASSKTGSNITIVNLPQLSLLNFRRLLLGSDIAAVSLENHLADLMYFANVLSEPPLTLYYPVNESRLAIFTDLLDLGKKDESLRDIYSYTYGDAEGLGEFRLFRDPNSRRRFIGDITGVLNESLYRVTNGNPNLLNSLNVVTNIVRMADDGKGLGEVLLSPEARAAHPGYRWVASTATKSQEEREWEEFISSPQVLSLTEAERILARYRKGMSLDDDELTEKLDMLTSERIRGKAMSENWPSIRTVSGANVTLRHVGSGGSFVAFEGVRQGEEEAEAVVVKYRYLHDNPFFERGYRFEREDRYHHILNTILAAQFAHGYTLPENVYVTPSLFKRFPHLTRLLGAGNCSLLEEAPTLTLTYTRRKVVTGTRDVRPELVILQYKTSTLLQRLQELAKANEVEKAKELIDKYLDLIIELWSAGVYVADLHLEGVGVDEEDNLRVIDLGTCPPRELLRRLPDINELDYPRPVYDEIRFTMQNRIAPQLTFNRDRHPPSLENPLNELRAHFLAEVDKKITLKKFIEVWATKRAELEKEQLILINRHLLEERPSPEDKRLRLEAIRQLKELEGRPTRPDTRVEADLHIHTCYSDGYSTPAQAVYEAYRKGLKAIAICDHNTTDGVIEALEAGEILGIDVIPAVEINTDKEGVEILGYFPDKDRFKTDCDLGRFKGLTKIMHDEEERIRRMQELVEKETGMVVSKTEIYTHGRPLHLMLRDYKRAFQTKFGLTPEAALEKVGKKWMPPGTTVTEVDLSPEGVIRYLKNRGAVVVLSQPRRLIYSYRGEPLEPDSEERFKGLIKDLTQKGLDGIEVSYNDQSEEQVRFIAKVATENGLIKTCGSGYHGKNFPGVELGRGQVTDVYPEGNLVPEYGTLEAVNEIKTRKLAEMAGSFGISPEVMLEMLRERSGELLKQGV